MNLIVFDTEYTYEFSKGNIFDPRNNIVSIAVLAICGERKRLYQYHFYEPSVSNCTLDDLHRVFSDYQALLIGHNVKVDVHWLDKLGIKHGERYYDTMFTAFVLAEGQRKPLSLKHLSGAKQELGDLLVHKHGVSPADIFPKWLLAYNTQDVYATYKLFKKQQRILKDIKEQIRKRWLPKNTYLAPIKLMNDLLPCIIEMERNGFCVNKEELERARVKAYEDRRILIRNIRKILRRLWGIKYFKITSSQQKSNFIYGSTLRPEFRKEWADYFASHNPFAAGETQRFFELYSRAFEPIPGLGVDPVLNAVRKASLSSDRDTLKELLHHNPGQRVLKLFYEESRLETLISTFIDGTIEKGFDRQGKFWLNTSYNQCVARTGRLSSSNPNLHNWPRAGTFPVRLCVGSRFPNGSIVASDASQLELRWGMWYYQDKQGYQDFIDGINIHSAIAAKAYGAGFTEEQRSNTKSTVFRVWYRGTARSIVRDQKIPIWDLAEAELVVDEILGRYQGVADGQECDLARVKQFGYLDTPTGRRYRFDLSHFSLKNKVANYPIQGGATGDFIPCAMIVAYRLFKRLKLRSVLIGQVHDELLADACPGEEQRVAAVLRYSLMNGGRREFDRRFGTNLDIPLDAGSKIKPHW
jgi:DNA polymerase I-like protein with 3'-5' exonuclease and polymerase domains